MARVANLLQRSRVSFAGRPELALRRPGPRTIGRDHQKAANSQHPIVMRLLWLSSACLAAAVCLAGCGYRLGPTNSVIAGDKSVQINPFSNQSFEPRLGDAVTTALRRQIQSDGTYHVATHGHADIVVSGVVTKYHRHELSFEPKDVLTVRDYRINVTAQV